MAMRACRRERGFTLAELMVVCALVGVLAALLAPALARAFEIADETACASNLRQIGFAVALYLKDSGGEFFPVRESRPGGVLWYFGFEPGGSASRGEGRRTLDRTQARLYPYLQSYETVEICPAFDYNGAYKPKYEGKWWTYGVNLELAGMTRGRSLLQVRGPDAARTVVFADAAQVNTFQAPASASNPLIEEWFYVQPGARYVHFRHGGRANVLMADWHIESLGPAPGSYDPRLPGARIGYFRPEDVLFRPRGAL